MVVTDLKADLAQLEPGSLGSDGRKPFNQRLHACVEHWIAAGVDMIQARNKSADDRQLLDRVQKLVKAVAGRAVVIVNSRADIALAAGADGVHLPVSSVPTAALRNALGQHPQGRFGSLLIGCSCHSRHQVECALDAGAHYGTFGPVFETPSKAHYGPPAGLAALADASQLGLPLLALGGVEAERLSAVAGHGASGAAAIRSLHDRERLVEMGRRVDECWPRAINETSTAAC